MVVGSRGIADIHKVTKAVVERLKRSGYWLGSHGGATAEGQREVLENLAGRLKPSARRSGRRWRL